MKGTRGGCVATIFLSILSLFLLSSEVKAVVEDVSVIRFMADGSTVDNSYMANFFFAIENKGTMAASIKPVVKIFMLGEQEVGIITFNETEIAPTAISVFRKNLLLSSPGIYRADLFVTNKGIPNASKEFTVSFLRRIDAIGTLFQIKGSPFMDITVNSTETMRLILEPRNNTVIMVVVPFPNSSNSTFITVTGLTPFQEYFLTQDGSPRLKLKADSFGKVGFVQDLTHTHYIEVRTNLSTIEIGGDTQRIQSEDVFQDVIFKGNNAGIRCKEGVTIFGSILIPIVDSIKIEGCSIQGSIGSVISTDVIIKNNKVRSSFTAINTIFGGAFTVVGNDVIAGQEALLFNDIADSTMLAERLGISVKDVSKRPNIVKGNVLNGGFPGLNLQNNIPNFEIRGNKIVNGIFLVNTAITIATAKNNTIANNEIFGGRGGIIIAGKGEDNVVENNTIDSAGTSTINGAITLRTAGVPGPGIATINTRVRNNTITNYNSFGILLASGISNNITNNTVLLPGPNAFFSMEAGFVNNFEIINNTLSDKDVLITNVTGNVFRGNLLTSSSIDGPTFFNNNNLFEGNIIRGGGISIGSFFNRIINNTIEGGSGISLVGGSLGAFFGEVMNNTILHSSRGIDGAGRGLIIKGNLLEDNERGIRFNDFSDSSITGNKIVGSNIGIELFASSKNITMFNNFLNNSINARDDGSGNKWNIAKTPSTNIIGGPFLGGNFWSDYRGEDVDGDGIGEDSHPIPGAAGSFDFLPLVFTRPPDIRPPLWFNNTTSPRSPAEFVPNQTYEFNVTWVDRETAIDTVLMEHNFNGTLVNETVPNSDLIGYWKFDEGAGTFVGDSSGNKRHGTIEGSVEFVDGVFGKAIRFDADNNRINFEKGDFFNTPTITISAWVNPASCTGDSLFMSIASKLFGKATPLSSYALILVQFDGECNPGFLFSIDGTFLTAVRGKKNLEFNKWHHVVATYDGSTTRMFVNGTEAEATFFTTPRSGPISPSTANFIIGSTDFFLFDFNGIIDEVQMWSRALTKEEVRNMFFFRTLKQGVFSFRTSNLLPDDYIWRQIANDTAGNVNSTDTFSYRVFDKNPPVWFNNTTSPETPALLVPNQTYEFNVTWIDRETRVDTVIMESNFTGILRNVTNQRMEDAVAFMEFEEGFGTVTKDSSSNNNTGMVFGAEWVLGKFGRGLNFTDGIFVDLGNKSILNQPRITLSAWVRAETAPSTITTVVSKWVVTRPFDPESSYFLGISPKLEPAVFITTNGRSKFPEFSQGFVSSTRLTMNKFHHIAATYDGSRLKLFIDGKLDSEIPASGNIFASPTNANIGLTADKAGDNFGIIDEVSIWDRALSEEEIRQLFLGKTSKGNVTTFREFNLSPATYEWREIANDTQGNVNTTDTFSYDVVNIPPRWSNNKTSPLSPTAFVANQMYEFNVTWEDDVAIDTVVIEHNFSGVLKNETVPAEGLLGYWRLDEGSGTLVFDYSGNNATGKIEGGAVFANGKFGTAVNFTPNFRNKRINFGNSSIFNFTKEVTVMAWANYDSVGLGAVVVKQAPSVERTFSLFGSGVPGEGLSFAVFNESDKFDFAFSGIIPQPRTFIHHAGTFNGTHIRVYVNGTESTAGTFFGIETFTGNLKKSIANITAGLTDVRDDAGPINATIDEILIFGRALKPEEIKQIADNRFLGRSTYTFRISNLQPGSYVWRQIANDTFGNANSTDSFRYVILGDVIPPAVQNLSCFPAVTNINKTIVCTAKITDDITGVNPTSVKAAITNPVGTVFNVTAMPLGNGLFGVSFSNTSVVGIYNLTLSASDFAGNMALEKTNFTITAIIITLDMDDSIVNLGQKVFVTGKVEFLLQPSNSQKAVNNSPLELRILRVAELLAVYETSTNTIGHYNLPILAPIKTGNYTINVSITSTDFPQKTDSNSTLLLVRSLNIDADTNEKIFVGGENVSLSGGVIDNQAGFSVGVANVVAVLRDIDGSVIETRTSSTDGNGLYSINFTAPGKRGMFQIDVNATDAFGIVGSNFTEFQVGSTNVTVMTDKNAYNAGDNVVVIAFITSSVDLKDVNLTLEVNGQEFTVFFANITKDVTTTLSGTFTAPFQIGTHIAEATFRKAPPKGQGLGAVFGGDFTEFKTRKLEVSVDANGPYIVGDTAIIEGFVTDSGTGKPVIADVTIGIQQPDLSVVTSVVKSTIAGFYQDVSFVAGQNFTHNVNVTAIDEFDIRDPQATFTVGTQPTFIAPAVGTAGSTVPVFVTTTNAAGFKKENLKVRLFLGFDFIDEKTITQIGTGETKNVTFSLLISSNSTPSTRFLRAFIFQNGVQTGGAIGTLKILPTKRALAWVTDEPNRFFVSLLESRRPDIFFRNVQKKQEFLEEFRSGLFNAILLPNTDSPEKLSSTEIAETEDFIAEGNCLITTGFALKFAPQLQALLGVKFIGSLPMGHPFFPRIIDIAEESPITTGFANQSLSSVSWFIRTIPTTSSPLAFARNIMPGKAVGKPQELKTLPAITISSFGNGTGILFTPDIGATIFSNIEREGWLTLASKSLDCPKASISKQPIAALEITKEASRKVLTTSKNTVTVAITVKNTGSRDLVNIRAEEILPLAFSAARKEWKLAELKAGSSWMVFYEALLVSAPHEEQDLNLVTKVAAEDIRGKTYAFEQSLPIEVKIPKEHREARPSGRSDGASGPPPKGAFSISPPEWVTQGLPRANLTQAFTITNAGNADLSGIEIGVTGPLSDWLTLKPLAQTALGPGQQTGLNALLSIPADAQPKKYIGHIHLSANPGIQPAQIMIEVDASG